MEGRCETQRLDDRRFLTIDDDTREGAASDVRRPAKMGSMYTYRTIEYLEQ